MPDTVQPYRMVVREGAGRPGRFDIHCKVVASQGWAQFGRLIGKSIEIEVPGSSVFQGIVASRNVSFDPEQGGVVFVLSGYDQSVSLAASHRSRCFGVLPFGDVVSRLAKVAGMRGSVTATALGRFDGRSQITQYCESDFGFLRRIAGIVGSRVWPYRGELSIGPGPGAGMQPLLCEEVCVRRLSFTVDYAGEPMGHRMPRFGSAFGKSPLIQDLEPARLLPEERPGDSGELLQRLATDSSWDWPTGVALEVGDAGKLATAMAAMLSESRSTGVVELGEPLPDGLVPGRKVKLVFRGTPYCEDAAILGVQHEVDGSMRTATLMLGHGDDERPDFRPAHHCWPAIVKAPVADKRALVKVAILGWDESSEEMEARTLARVAAMDKTMLRGPEAGELVLVGFQDGDPDQPVVLGSLPDLDTPKAASMKDVLVAYSSKDGKQACSVEVVDGKLKIKLEKLSLDVTVEEGLSLSSKKVMDLTTGAGLNLNAKSEVTVKGSKMAVEKG